jgi:hypothetical protein
MPSRRDASTVADHVWNLEEAIFLRAAGPFERKTKIKVATIMSLPWKKKIQANSLPDNFLIFKNMKI